MASNDLVLHFIYPTENVDADLRTFQIKQIVEGSAETLDMYKACVASLLTIIWSTS